MTRRMSRWLGASTIGAFAGLALATTVAAHVHVDAEGEAVAGQPAQLVFEVPNERDDQATVSIEVQMPQDFDLVDVVPAEVEGWTVTTTTRDDDIVDTIRWEATGAGLVGDERVSLPVAVGPLPAVELLEFPTIQTYDGGDVVRWIEPAPPGEPEPDLPVPTLAIAAAAPGATTAPKEPPATVAPAPTQPADTAAPPATEPVTPPTDAAVVATAPPETAPVATPAGTTEETAPVTVVDDEDGGDDPAVWPWVVAGIVVVVVGGGAAIAAARRRPSG
ncbi:MAG: DUF1775 domain-containing protein [Ilumatobacteraceae bacterium]